MHSCYFAIYAILLLLNYNIVVLCTPAILLLLNYIVVICTLAILLFMLF